MVYPHAARQRQLDATFSALADPTRREILARLATGSLSIGELAGRFDMTLPAVSKHIYVLERAGLARVRREGRVRRTTLVAAPMRDALAWIEEYRRFWEQQLDQLAQYLEKDTTTQEAPCSAQRQPRSPVSKSDAPSTRRARASGKRGRRRPK